MYSQNDLTYRPVSPLKLGYPKNKIVVPMKSIKDAKSS